MYKICNCKPHPLKANWRWLVQLEWRRAGWSVWLPLLIFPCTIKSRSSLLAPAHPGGHRKRAVKRMQCIKYCNAFIFKYCLWYCNTFWFIFLQCSVAVLFSWQILTQLECGPMPSVMATSAQRRKVWLMPTTRVPCSKAANIGECKTWTQSEFWTWQNSIMGQEPPTVYI